MAQVLVGIGSNIERYRHIAAALDALNLHFGELQISRVFESESIGFKGSHFLNLVVGFNCPHSVAALAELLHRIEDDNGRCRTGPRFSSRTLDIDILTYDAIVGDIDGVMLPRTEITYNAFVLLPLVDLVADSLHPQLRISYRQLWAQFAQSSQRLWSVDFDWRGVRISNAE